MAAQTGTVTILFTDLVGSTELLQRAGDEQAQRIFKAHHRLLSEAVQHHGGHEVKWLGDGLMVAFPSAAEAVRCAIAMQQGSRRPAAGERLQVRVGLNVGEVLVDESDYFGTSVVIARRLCDRAEAGQIFASEIVMRLLDGRGSDVATNDLGALELTGITNAVPAVEIIYQHDPMALLRKLPFVGRRAEYETLLRKLAEASNGRGSVVLVSGEPGIGKTRLTEEFCEHASSSAVVIRGNCYEGDVAAPFGPWLEALRSLVEQLSDAKLREALGPGAADVTIILPDLRRRLPDTEDAARADPESERARLFESVSAFLRNVADERPLVAFIDDLHWCDKPSLALLELVARGVSDRRIMIVGTYRDAEVDRVHPLAQTLAACRRMEHHERIALRSFTADSVYELLTAIEPSEQAEPAKRALAAVLHAEAEGNPFFIREVLNHLIETGKLVQQDGVWAATVTSIEDLGIPEGIKEVIGRRLSRLSEGCNAMLTRASAMTGGFTWEELRAISDEPEASLLDSLDEALSAQLIAERTGGEYAFTHALIRATLYDELSRPRRVMLHRRIAEQLETLYANDLGAHLGELAAHYMASAGGDAQKGVEYSIRAGEQAMAQYAWEEAVVHYERALQAMQMLGARAANDKGDLLLRAAEAQLAARQVEAAMETFRAAAGAAREAGDVERLARAAIGFEDANYGVVGTLELREEALALLDEALEAAGPEESSPRLRLLLARQRPAAAIRLGQQDEFRRGGFGSWSADDESLVHEARALVSMAERLDDRKLLLSALLRLVPLLRGLDDTADALARATKAVALAKELGHRHDEGVARFCLLYPLADRGDMGEFRSELDALAQFIRETRERFAAWPEAAARVMLAIVEGHFAEAEAALQPALALGQETGWPDAVTAFGAQLFLLRLLQGRAAEMEPLFRRMADESPNVAVYRSTLALIYSQSGQLDKASQEVVRLVADGLANIPRDFLWPVTLGNLSEACRILDDRRAAALLYDLLLPYADMNIALVAVTSRGAASGSLGQLATVLDRWDDAERHFDHALEMNERMGFLTWLAVTRSYYGEMLLRRAASPSARPDDPTRARSLLSEALSAAREIGMAHVVASCERLLPEPPPAEQGPLNTMAVPAAQPQSFASGRYTVARLLGEGGQKIVYLARDTQLNRDVAVALLKAEGLEQASLDRIKREAQAMAQLEAQPQIVAIYDIGEHNSRPFIVCEYLAGGTLEDELARAGCPLPVERSLAITRDLCRALSVAHEHGIIHRDIKPSNVWFTPGGNAKLGDFGLAMSQGRSRMTRTGTVIGTPSYMAPEQALGREVDERSDIYSLGCVLYQMLAGRPPFVADDTVAVVYQHIEAPPVALSELQPGLPPALETVVLQMLAKAPEDRPQTAAEVLAALAM